MYQVPVESLPFDISSLHAAYQRGLAPRAVLAEVHRRIGIADDPGIFIDLFDDADLQAQCDTLGGFDPTIKPLWGIPFVVKDNIDVSGRLTTAACPAFATGAEHDAVVVARLRAAGAIVVGKTNLDQFATGLVGTRSPYQPPRNPVSNTLVPGGSSSGSAVAVAHGIVSFSLGTDTAGSGRVPAALNNIVGLKPTLGLISARGVVPACRTLDTVSIFALRVDDAYQVLTTATAFDPDDPYSRDIGIAPHTAPLRNNLPGVGSVLANRTIGVPDDPSLARFGEPVHNEMFAGAVLQLKALGASVYPIDFSDLFAVADLLYSGAWLAERYTVIEALLTDQPDAVFPVTRQLVGAASGISAAQAFRDGYELRALQRRCNSLIGAFDALCVPTIPTLVTLEQDRNDPVGPNNLLGRYTNFVNLLDMAGIAVPVTRRADGLPGNVTLLGQAGSDNQLATFAAVLSDAMPVSPGVTGWDYDTASGDSSADAQAGGAALPAGIKALTGANETAIVAVGAHMSGMPLNHELTGLNARKLCAARTRPGYRLYKLAGGPPPRPGLVRDASGDNIAVEVWALPTDRVGEFLSRIPSPLGLGTVFLENDEPVTGFICESAGLDGATDVTAFGGWRSYIDSLT